VSKTSLAGAASLLGAPLVVIVAALVSTTLSDEAGDQVAAFGSHHGAMVAGAFLQGLSILLLIAGAGWLAVVLAPRARSLAVAGGAFAVLGSLPVVYDDGVHAAVAALASGLDPAQPTATIDRVLSSAGVKAVEPFSLLGDLGLALLGIAAAKAGAPRWTAAAIVIGAFGEGAGFATATKPFVIGAFALLFVGLAAVVRTLVAGAPAHTREPQVDVRLAGVSRS
jgi:hypothetical protein